MALGTDLVGLGLPPLLAGKMAQGGVGPLTITAAGTTYAASTKIKCLQRLVSVTNDALGSLSVGLPVVGSDNGANLGDMFVINNSGGANTVQVRASTGVLISAGGANDSVFQLTTHASIAVYPISSTQWVGIS